MINERVVVHMLLAVGYHRTVELYLRTFALQIYVYAVTRYAVGNRYVVVAHRRIATCLYIQIVEVAALLVCLLQLIHVEVCTILTYHLHYLQREICRFILLLSFTFALALDVINEEDGCLTEFLHYYQHTPDSHGILLSR